MKGMGQPSYRLLTANENFMYGEKPRHLQQLQRAFLFRNLRKQSLTCRTWHSQSTLPTMVHCQAFCSFGRQPPSRRHTLFATWRRTVQPLHCMLSHLLNSIVIFIPCTYMI